MLPTKLYEEGDRLFLVGPTSLFTPTDDEMAEYAFSEALKKRAPNPNLLWMHGQYVEGDIPNGNKAMWTSEELAIKSLTPMYCPVTVMHDPTTAVGLIADVKLRTPQADNVPRAKIDSTLAVWAHRFPEIAAECTENAQQGSLMQSMECFSPSYSCADCGTVFHKLPGRAERENWCAHLNGDHGEVAARILERVVFTGVGLIFGTRGISGADPNAHLELEEVAAAHAEFHERSGHQSTRPRSNRVTENTITIERTEYDRLKAAEVQIGELREKADKAEKLGEEKAELQTKLDASEVAKKAAEDEKTELDKKVKNFEEKANQETLSTERTGKLGSKFKKALPEDVLKRLEEQAGKLSEDDWKGRLEELAALVKVKSDENEDGSETPPETPAGEQDFTSEEAAQAGVGAGGSPAPANGNEPSRERRASVLGSLAGIGESESDKGK